MSVRLSAAVLCEVVSTAGGGDGAVGIDAVANEDLIRF